MAATKKASKAPQTAVQVEEAPESTETLTDAQTAALNDESANLVMADDGDDSVFVPPVADPDFISTGAVTLARKMTRRAQSNVMDLMYNGNTETARAFWRKRLVSEGVLSA